ncbi:serine hydrolase domain-containing protein [Marinifilum caeruleilacunae]|uniref:Class A beta-lactamase-related serine hydrolase n=1 Tax=Marinifilum caeruleilacunae TaxID=2499076 RepID=A0ABX1WUX0_9BACT|nr:serine hydrolase domain-containing protein [Marinifilum caeruleilacunae]NOU59910.1 class A beta-lactamase-related serine hydrolase [Marinifilum caeruleilacunae]
MKQLLIVFSILCSFFSLENKVCAQNPDNKTSNLNAWIDSQFTEGLNSFNIAGATFVLMQGDSILHMNGYGVTDIRSNKPVNSSSSIFGIGSISKTFVATAIMQLVENGKLELDRDVNTYLTSFQISYKFDSPITVRQLLTHTAGIDYCNISSSVRTEKEVIPLAQYLKKQMPSQIRPSGKVASYSNQGYALLGLIVEEVSGFAFDEYVRQKILKPLEMNFSGFKRQTELKENYVTSYLQKNGQLIPHKPDFPLFYPSASFQSTASDMGHYISMFLNNGKFNGKQILDSTTLVKMTHTPFKQYEKAGCGWLLGFPEYQWKGMKYFGHSGRYLGFTNQMSLFPEKNIGLFISVNSSNYVTGKSRVFIDQFINELLTRIMPTDLNNRHKAKTEPKIGSVDEPLEKFAGHYRYTLNSHTTFEKVGILIGLAPEIEIVAKDSTLEVMPWNDTFLPVSGLTFYSKRGWHQAFGRNAKGEIGYFFAEAHSYEKLRWYEPATFLKFWIGSIVLILSIYIITCTIIKLFVCNKKNHLVKKTNFCIASLIIVFVFILAFALLTTDPMEFFYGVPMLIKIALVLPFIIIPLVFFTIYLIIKAIRFKELGTFDLVYQSLIIATALFFIPWLAYFNLIGFNY